MKKSAVSLLLFLAVVGLSAAGLDDLIKQAQSEYAAGNAADALKTLGVALSSGPTNTTAKRSLADAYADIGAKEYSRRNFKNAYECFKNAVKLSPTNQIASKYFWQMKAEMNINALKNEADEAAQKAPTTQGAGATGGGTETAGSTAAGGTATGGTTVGGATPALVEGSAVYKEALDKLEKTEQELAALRASTSTATQESAALKTELERQKEEAERQLEAIRASALAAQGESQALKMDMERYRTMIEQLNQRVQNNDQTASRDAKALTELLQLYQKNIDMQGAASQEGTKYLADQLAEQNKLYQLQFQTLSARNLFLFGGLGIVTLLVILFILLIVRAQLRRRRVLGSRETALAYPAMSFGGEAEKQERGRAAVGESMLLEFYPETEKPAETAPSGGDAGMYRDLMRAERIRRMHEQMKQGSLKWETVREYIGELEKDLRIEILKVVENRIMEEDGSDPRAILPVLFPFLTEHDDYLREKAESLVRETLAGRPREGRALLPMLGQGATQEADDSPLGLPKLMEITENLRKILKDRERSTVTARVARGMARGLGLSTADAELLYKSALAHDAGYLLLDPDRLVRILGKPVLTEEDFEFIRSHTKKGVEYFKGMKMPEEFKDGILYHHERNDGSGYPKGLKGPKIPLFAKLIGVAETYVALTSARPYREKLSYEAAIAVIRDGVGRKFDKEHIDALAEAMRRSGGSA